MQCQQQLNTITSMEYITKILPSWLDDYLLFEDSDIFDVGEKESLDKFISDNKLGECIGCQPPDKITEDHELDPNVFPVDYAVYKFIFKTLE
jgi:hypothetical protein